MFWQQISAGRFVSTACLGHLPVGLTQVTRQVCHAFIHGNPHLGWLLISLTRAANSEFTWIIDHRFHAQHEAELVVHLQPIFFHAMFHSCSRLAFLLAVGEHFTLKVAVQLATCQLYISLKVNQKSEKRIVFPSIPHSLFRAMGSF